MNLRKFGILLLALLFTFGIITGCGKGGTKTEEKKSSENNQGVIEIKLSHSSPATNDRLETACQAFKKYVEEHTNGRVKVTTYPASVLGGEREQLEGVQMGTIQMAALSTGPFPGIFPEIMVFDMPYLFPQDTRVVYKVLDGPVGQEISDLLLKKTGVRNLAFGENGFRHYTNSVRPIKKPGDMKGLKIRTMENPAHMAIVKALGGSPTPMAFNEVYSALQTKTVDGQENPISLIVSMKFYEVQKYLTLDGHIYNPYLLIINDKFYNSLPEDIRKVIDEGAKVWQKVEREENQKQIEAGMKVLKNAGMVITELTPEELEAFKQATKTVYDQFKSQIGEELLNKVIKAVEEAQKEIQ
ncbi:DctP family TRAP transporter solute-binding subunit [Carboxydothermus hydrogenoformans]|uniref:TRAP dicarboxylate transporter, DctP subunit n=1 Tax=Carboxydothermus hydrogenoformans (strain ATCC BAA-161 / DSM 6008 / Z-2901) TaxID=246194 RepID=Q3ACJ9_CARHZ|nr:DctP family TRAP transporter solute-binding subunit [Carboxydothermus hydrogenoformans]ABB14368.1 TRAP dicarboxylate transporter, DctP subunit [Carboxydothermus hydrogenoformans Z-2901]